MSNFFDEWHAMRAFAGAVNNKKGTLSTTAVVVKLTTPGVWTASADVEFYISGPHATSTAAATTDRHEWDKDLFVFRTDAANQYISMVRCGSVSGNYYIGRLKGF